MTALSIVIPAYNSERTLEACLQALKASEFKDYELVVVDAASQDETNRIAKKYADQVIWLESPSERSHVRSFGAQAARGTIIVNIDSDVLVRPETLGRIHAFFQDHPEFDALTGILSKDIPYPDFFSQYKNLYMHFIFRQLPDQVTFLYGSIHAIRREARDFYVSRAKIADDTALGQELAASGKRIAFLRDLEVIHLKKYGFLSWIKNDFQIPYDWAKIFIQYRGWKQLGRNKTGFAHASKRQLLSVVLAPGIVAIAFLNGAWFLPLLFCWMVLNGSFIAFLARERGAAFGWMSAGVTFLDHLTMAAGIISGLLCSLIEPNVRQKP